MSEVRFDLKCNTQHLDISTWTCIIEEGNMLNELASLPRDCLLSLLQHIWTALNLKVANSFNNVFHVFGIDVL